MMPKMLTRVVCGAIAGAGGVLLGPAAAGGQPLNAYSFKASHNSYERSESLSHQVLRLNCWALELDLCWDTQTDRFICRHMADGPNPCLFPPRHPLEHYLTDLMSDERILSRVTMLYLDAHAFECSNPVLRHCGQLTVPRIQALIAELNAHLGEDRVYTVRDFDYDNQVWPSPQELLARGKHFIIFINKGSNWDQYNYFHHQAEFVSEAAPTTSMINKASASLATGEEPGPSQRFMWRSYPDLFDLIEAEDLAHWNLALQNNFNLVACNHLDRRWTEGSGTIPALPMHVYRGAPEPPFGTVYLPYPNLRSAIQRVEQVNVLDNLDRTEPYPFILSGNPPAGPDHYVGTGPVNPEVPITIRPNDGRVIYIKP